MKTSRFLQAPPGMIKLYSLASIICAAYLLCRGPTALTASIALALLAEGIGLWYLQRWAPWLGLTIMVAIGLLFVFYLGPKVQHRELKGLGTVFFGVWAWWDLRKEYRNAQANRRSSEPTDAPTDLIADNSRRQIDFDGPA